MALSQSFTDMRRGVKTLSDLRHTCPAEVKHCNAIPSCVSSHPINKHPFYSLFCATFFFFFCVCMISLFKMAPALVWKCCLVFLCARISKVPSGENPCDELHSYVSYSIVGHEFNVTNQQHILSEASLDRNVYKTCDSDVITRGRIEPNPVFPLGATVHYSIIQHSRSLYRTQLLQRMRSDYSRCSIRTDYNFIGLSLSSNMEVLF